MWTPPSRQSRTSPRRHDACSTCVSSEKTPTPCARRLRAGAVWPNSTACSNSMPHAGRCVPRWKRCAPSPPASQRPSARPRSRARTFPPPWRTRRGACASRPVPRRSCCARPRPTATPCCWGCQTSRRTTPRTAVRTTPWSCGRSAPFPRSRASHSTTSPSRKGSAASIWSAPHGPAVRVSRTCWARSCACKCRWSPTRWTCWRGRASPRSSRRCWCARTPCSARDSSRPTDRQSTRRQRTTCSWWAHRRCRSRPCTRTRSSARTTCR